jgi:hypothetical protein
LLLWITSSSSKKVALCIKDPESLGSYLMMRGYPIPEGYNPAVWLVEVPQTNDLETLEKSNFY